MRNSVAILTLLSGFLLAQPSFTAADIISNLAGASAVSAADMDNDGDNDIIATALNDDEVIVFTNETSGLVTSSFAANTISTSADGVKSVYAADIDNDYVIEFVISSKNKHCYVINQFGNIELEYETSQYLMASPSLANLDNDDDLEIAIAGYSNSSYLHVINFDGSPVENFPLFIGEKVLRGPSIYDVDENGLHDIVLATESNNIYIMRGTSALTLMEISA